jgi:hypothetical protein
MNLRHPLLLGSLALVSACYDFDPEADRFVCTSDDDCAGDHVCAGHTVVDNGVVSYCVAEADATAGLALFIGQRLFNCNVFGEAAVGGVDWLLAAEAYPNATDAVSLTPASPPTCTPGVTPTATCCIGEPAANGGGRLVCLAPRASVAKMAVSLRYVRSSDGLVLGTVVGEKEIPADGPPLAELTVNAFDLDYGGDRCTGRAMAREQHCSTTIDCACGDGSDCPPSYTCGGGACTSQ